MTAKQQLLKVWEGLEGPNLAFVQELYEKYLQDPASIDDKMRQVFDQWGEPPSYHHEMICPHDPISVEKGMAAARLLQMIRVYGHLQAKMNSFTTDSKEGFRPIHPAIFGLNQQDLTSMPASLLWKEAPQELKNGWDVIQHMFAVYTGTTAYQFTHIHDEEERQWLNQAVEKGSYKRKWPVPEQISLLTSLLEVEEFEQFLHQAFAGQKRFSIEGVDSLVPMLQHILGMAAQAGTQTAVMGMAHRGRLNVLAHVLKKPLEAIFSEFHHAPNPDLVPSEGSMGLNHGWTGDVKYHLGADKDLEITPSKHIRVVLANNPSHLELVGSVVEGFTRAAQEKRQQKGAPEQVVDQAFAIIIHGDAAFPGEGIVAETMNLSRLRGYHTGGTIHIIANNQVGFTTDSEDSRSTTYASDAAKGFQVPIVHVNADDPQACLEAMELAFAYRKRFHKDILIDLIGFRRYGHNEMDDPMVTQPLLYQQIAKHPGVRTLYADYLKKEGIIKEVDLVNRKREVQLRLQQALEKSKQLPMLGWHPLPACPTEAVETKVELGQLREINEQLLQWPADFHPYPKLQRILQRRKEALLDGGTVDWALAEVLAFGTLLKEGVPVRLSGQDAERGTFAHRHLALHDVETGKRLIPLQQFSGAKASFAVYNSPLSETAVMGFEYGYDIQAKDALVVWEAQYGDFVNVAQPILDNFLAAGRAKWGQISNLVLLLPHGYEGQGPEHSSARPERFLQLAAEENMRIVQPTSAAQYFHLLRQQATGKGREEGRPLIILTPKGLLRQPLAFSTGKELAEGSFLPLVEKNTPQNEVERLILCTGKIALELEEKAEAANLTEKGIHIVRVEQLYPLPEEAWKELGTRFAQVKEVVWVQEEPQNMGSWSYMEPKLKAWTQAEVRYIGRPHRASPAEGLPNLHKQEQQRIIREALKIEE